MKFINIFTIIAYFLSPLMLYLEPQFGWLFFMFCGLMCITYFGVDIYYDKKIKTLDGELERMRKDPQNYYVWRS